MKKGRAVTIVTISLALVLIGTVTYAAGKKKEVKPKAHTPQVVSEDEALKAELLAAAEEPGKERAVPPPSRREEGGDVKDTHPEGT